MRVLILLISFTVLFQPTAWADNQAGVAMPDSFSAQVAQSILQQGGNAVDAAVAASFALAVTYPEAGNLGGGGFMTLHFQGENYFLDYREVAPIKAHRDMYLDESGHVIPNRSLLGSHASGVPGTVMGMWQAHQRFGQLEWSQLLQPAILLAQNGFEVHPELAKTADWYQAWSSARHSDLNFQDYFADLKSGVIFKQTELAATLKRIAEHGAREFYQGRTAELIVQQMQQDSGLISLEDLASYQVKWRQPITANWQGYQIVSAPPPSSGGIALIQLLLIQAELEHEFEGLHHNSAEYVHLLAEINKRVYADRAEYLGDPDFHNVPVKKLIDPAYLESRAQQVNPIKISTTEKIQPGLVESEQTTHFSIIDADGNAVSNTTTLNMPFGNGVVVEGAGFLMNNEMDDFSAKPGVPNLYGVIGGEANSIAAGKRMLSSMTPTLLLKDGQIYAALGTPGGSTIITSVFQTIMNLVAYDMTPQQAVDADRVHHQLWPKDEIGYHPELSASVIQTLTDMGYQLKPRSFLGDVQLLTRTGFNQVHAAADQRGRGEGRVWSASPGLVMDLQVAQ